MEKRRLGTSELEITRIGFGAWAIGGSWEWGWGSQDDADSIRTIHQALDRGVNWIDTAPVYGLGHSEEVVARALRETRHEPYLFTKCGLVWDADGKVSHTLKRTSIEKEIDASLRRLRVDVLDLCQIHWPIPDEDLEEAWTALAEIREQQKIRYIGVSNFSVEQLERVRPIAEVTSNQPPFSLVFPEVGQDVLPYCHQHGIGVVNYSPMASGLLSGKMTRERIRNLPDDDWRKKNKEFKEPRVTRHLKLAGRLQKIASRHGSTAAEVAIAWTLQNPAVTAAIVGLRRPEQIDGVIHAAELRLTDDDNRAIDAARTAGG
ncbi:MAG: aldo/keto reductase [bacterium]|nr:aldo/keto reductase [bacterium]